MTEELKKPKARKGRASLPPKLLSGAHLLGKHFSVERTSFMTIERDPETKTVVYLKNGRYYTVPQVDEPPALGYNWRCIGVIHTRAIFAATRKLTSAHHRANIEPYQPMTSIM